MHRGAARRYDYGPTRTDGWSKLANQTNLGQPALPAQSYQLNFKGDQVLYICNSRSRPGCTLGFLFFRPGAHGPTQYRLRALHVYGDPAGV